MPAGRARLCAGLSDDKVSGCAIQLQSLPWAFPKHASIVAGEVVRCGEPESLGNRTDRVCAELVLLFRIHQQALHLLKPNLFEQLHRETPNCSRLALVIEDGDFSSVLLRSFKLIAVDGLLKP